MLQIGNKVKIKESKYLNNLANSERVGKIGMVEKVHYGLQLVYKIRLDEPIQNKWGIQAFVNCYDFHNCLEVLQ